MLGENYHHVLTSDRWTAYTWIKRRQLCWAHLRRDFQAMIDRENSGSFVGQDDLNIVLGDWGNMPPGDPRADPSGDGFVGQDDLNPVLADWGQGTPPVTLAGSSLSAAAVPEPNSLLLVLFGITGIAAWCRKRRSCIVIGTRV